MSLADRIAVMNGGRIVQADAPVEVYRNPAARFVGSFIGNPPMNFLPAEPRRRRAAGASPGRRSCPARTRHGERIEFAHPPRGPRRSATGGIPADGARRRAARRRTRWSPPTSTAACSAPCSTPTPPSRPATRSRSCPQPDRIRWFDPETDEGRCDDRRPATTRSTAADRHPARERPRQLHRADQGPLPVPVELGFLPDRARPARTSTRTAPGPRSRRCSRTSGRTAWCRTSSSTCTDDGYFPGPDVWAHRPADRRPPASPSRRRRLRACAGSGERAADRAARRRPRPRAPAEDRRLAPLVLRATATRTARASSRSSTPGNRAATTRSTGTRPSSGCRPRASRPTPAATPSTPTRRTGRPRRSTTATSGSCSTSAASAGTTRSCTTPRRSRSSIPASTPS